MIRYISRVLTFSIFAAILGCSASTPSTSDSPGQNPPIQPTGKPRFAYTGNEGGSVSGFSVDPSTGALTALNGFPLSIGNNPTTVAHDPQNRFLIVGDISSGEVSVFSIDGTTGALTLASSINLATEPVAAVVDPSGTHLYLLGAGANAVYAYTLSSTGALTPVTGQPFTTGEMNDFDDALMINSAGTFMYAQNFNGVTVYSITASTGALTQVQTITGISYPGGAALDPSGNYLYVADAIKNTLSAYSISASTGMLTLAKTSAMALGSSYTLAISPTDQYAYTIEDTTNLVAYSMDNGSFTPIGTVSGLFGLQIAVDPSGSFVYVPQACSQNCPGGIYNVVNEFAIGRSGGLSKISGSPVATGVTPTGITITTQ